MLIQHEKNEWRFPGGGKECDESFEDTVRREGVEETGISPEGIELVGAFKVLEMSKQDTKPYFQLCGVCKAGEGQRIIPSSENVQIDEVKFVLPNEVFNYVNWGRHGEEMFATAISHWESIKNA